jgi:dolichol-phosphate mannosyltransferase
MAEEHENEAGATVPGTPGVGLGNAPGVDAGVLPLPPAEADGEGLWRAAVLLLPQAISTSAVARTRDERMSTRATDFTPGVHASDREVGGPREVEDFVGRKLESAPGMIRNLKVGVVIPAYNEAASLQRLLPQIPSDLCDLIVVVNDGSTDGTSEAARSLGATVIDRPERGGPGPAIRDGLDLLRSKRFDIAAVMASNGKHDPAQLPDLIRPLAEDSFDLVRGSRHLEGGGHVNIPWHRLFLIQVFTVLFSALAGRRVTDATGGYQAYRLKILDDPRINLHQQWLGRYEVETYLFAKTLLCGYRWKEVPIQITYAGGKKPYTRARPIVDWWGYFRPVLMLRFGLKR